MKGIARSVKANDRQPNHCLPLGYAIQVESVIDLISGDVRRLAESESMMEKVRMCNSILSELSTIKSILPVDEYAAAGVGRDYPKQWGDQAEASSTKRR